MTETKPKLTPEQEEAEKKNDELIKAWEDEKKAKEAPDSQTVKAQEKAAKLNQIYNEKFQLPVRKTGAQENAEKADKEAHPSTSHPPHK